MRNELDSPISPSEIRKTKRRRHRRSDFGDHKIEDRGRKRHREQGNDGIHEPPTVQKQIVAAIRNSSIAEEEAQKQSVAETVNVPSLPRKSAHTASRYWSPEEELAFFNGILSYCEGGTELPFIMVPVYDYVKPMLPRQFSNAQMSKKFRLSRAKFHSIKAKIELNNFSSEKIKHEFDSPYQAILYKLWMQLWGQEKKGGDEHCSPVGHAENASVRPKFNKKHVEADKKNKHKIVSQKEQGKQEEDGESEPKTGDVKISRELYNQFCVERDAALEELKIVIQNLVADNQSQMKAMLQRSPHQC